MSNSLAAVHPELIAEWSDRNLPLTPDLEVLRSFLTFSLLSSMIKMYNCTCYRCADFGFTNRVRTEKILVSLYQMWGMK